MTDPIEPISEKNEIALLKVSRQNYEKNLQNYQFQWWVAICYIVVCGLLGYGYTCWKYGFDRLPLAIPYVISGVAFGIFIYSYVIFIIRTVTQNALRRIELKLAKFGGDELKEKLEDNFFTKLVQINFKYIDQYYLQTQEQAEKSFRLAVFASVSGLTIIATGIIILYIRENAPLAGYVTTSAGVLSQFIAAVFFYLYNQTILKMSQYHQKLVITQNISLALKITDELDKDSKAKCLEILIDRLTSDVNRYLTESKS